VNQDPLGRPAGRISQNGSVEVWARDLADGSKAVGLFNRGRKASEVKVSWTELGLTGKHSVRDLWRQRDIGDSSDGYAAEVARHGVVLIRVK